MKVDTHRLNRDLAVAWALMPQVFQRVRDFCTKMNTDTSPSEAEDWVRAMFVTNDPRFGFWVAATGDGHVVGHIWVTPEPFHMDTYRYSLVRQAEVDTGIDIREPTKQVFAEIDAWSRSLGIDSMQMLTHRNAKAMSRSWGFVPYKVLMTRTIPREE